MKFELPGQLRGANTRPVISVAVQLRRKLEPLFESLMHTEINETSIILRVGGELGSFGPDNIEEPYKNKKSAVCEIVIEQRNWENFSSLDINILITPMINSAIKKVFNKFGIDEEKTPQL